MSEIPTETKKSHVMTRSGSSLAFGHSFIFISFKSDAFAETQVLPGAVVNLLPLVSVALFCPMKGYSLGPSARSKQEFVKRELCNIAVAEHARRSISPFKCCTSNH